MALLPDWVPASYKRVIAAVIATLIGGIMAIQGVPALIITTVVGALIAFIVGESYVSGKRVEAIAKVEAAKVLAEVEKTKLETAKIEYGIVSAKKTGH